MTIDTDPTAADLNAAASETSAVSVFRCRHVQLTAVLTAAVVLATVLIFDLNLFHGLVQVKADIWLALPFIQALGAAAIRIAAGPPNSVRARCVVLALHLLCGTGTVLLYTGDRKWVLIQSAGILLRLVIAGGWLAVVIGTVVLAETIRRRNTNWKSWVPGVLRICFACTVVIVPLEFTAGLIEDARRAELPLPEELKPSDTVHIAAIGGSTMRGFPYDPHYGIGQVAVWQLRQMFPEHRIVLDNLAQTGISLEQAKARLWHSEALPDVVIVYSGHNEFFHGQDELTAARKTGWGAADQFFRRSSLFRVLNGIVAQYAMIVHKEGDVRAQLCSIKISPDYLLEKRVQRYQMQLEQLFQWATSNNVAVVYCVPAACEADFEPNSSAPDEYAEEARRSIESFWKKIRDHEKSKQWDLSRTTCLQALKQYPHFAEFHFRLGKSLQKLGHTDEAAEHFRLALDHDQLPVRCLTSYRKAGLRAAVKHNVPVLDCAEFLLRHSETGYLDHTQFPDGVHPNLRTTYQLGRAVADVIAGQGLPNQTGTPVVPKRTSFQESTEDLKIDAAVLAAACATTADVLRRYAACRPFDMTRRMSEAERFRNLSEDLSSGDLSPGQGGTESLTETVPYFGLTSSN